MKGVGEPCAGEPHARFDGRGLETERYGVTAPAPDPTILLIANGSGYQLFHTSDSLEFSPSPSSFYRLIPLTTQLLQLFMKKLMLRLVASLLSVRQGMCRRLAAGVAATSFRLAVRSFHSMI